MRMVVNRYEIRIIPESSTDKAYLEEVFGLKEDGDTVKAMRVNAMELGSWAYLVIFRGESERNGA